jgi:hypothetical protein
MYKACSKRRILDMPSAFKVTGHPFWRFVENRYCMRAQNQSDFHQNFTKCWPVHAKYDKVVKLTNNKIV